MSMTFHLHWLKEKGVIFKDGPCEDGYELAKKLAGKDKDIDAFELFDIWINSDEVEGKLKMLAIQYKKSKIALEAYMLKKFGNLDNVVYKNEFKVSNGAVSKTCKTEATAKKYKEQFIDEEYNSLDSPVTVYLLRKDGFLVNTSLQAALAYKVDNVSFVIKSKFGHSYEVDKQNLKTVYDRVVSLVRNEIQSDRITVKRLISDPDDFFEVWVEHTV